MSQQWAVERGVFPENEKSLEQILGDRLVYFTNSIDGFEFEKDIRTPFIVYSSIVAGRKLLRAKNCINWLYNSVYNCNYYLHKFGNLALNNIHIYTTKANLPNLIDMFGKEQLFIKENSGYKTFTGQVFDHGTMQDLQLVYPEDFLLLAPKKSIEKEWRVVISDGKPLTGSGYPDTKECGQDVLDFAEKCVKLSEYDPAPMWTLDICQSNGELKVLEANSLLSSGWYFCDTEKIIKEVDRFVDNL